MAELVRDCIWGLSSLLMPYALYKATGEYWLVIAAFSAEIFSAFLVGRITKAIREPT